MTQDELTLHATKTIEERQLEEPSDGNKHKQPEQRRRNMSEILDDSARSQKDAPLQMEELPTEGQPTSLVSTPAVDVPATRVNIERQVAFPPEDLASLPRSEVNRQTIIGQVISMEEHYIRDLDFVEKVFIRPLRNTDHPIIPDNAEEFIKDVFANILDLRECNRCLLKAIYARQREQGEIISRIGDIFLNAVPEFRFVYPAYIGRIPRAEKRLEEEIKNNGAFKVFLELCSLHPDNVNKMDLKDRLSHPSEHLYKYQFFIEAIRAGTAEGDPDDDLLKEAAGAMRNLQSIAQLRTFQTAMGKGPTGKFRWHNFVPKNVRNGIEEREAKRQAIIFELIREEVTYVGDLGNIKHIFARPLLRDPHIIPRERLETFIRDVFHNFGELHACHRQLLDKFFEIQRKEHPIIRSIAAPMYDAVLNFRDAYSEYVSNYPIAARRIDDELANNQRFKYFAEECARRPDTYKLSMKSFIKKPIPRLLRYELLLQGILKETSAGHDDLETIPAILNVLKALRNETEPGVVSTKQKDELREYSANLVFKPEEYVDMDLLNENRSLIHTGKFLQRSEKGFTRDWLIELFALLFDNYLVITKPKVEDGVTKYQVYLPPVRLDKLTLGEFDLEPAQRGGWRSPFAGRKEAHGQNRDFSLLSTLPVYPFTFQSSGRLGGWNTVSVDSAQARLEWKDKLEEAIGLRQVWNKVFEVEPLGVDIFLPSGDMWDHKNVAAKVNCSIPFTTADGRPLVAAGCAEGVWVGYRHDSQSMRQVLNLRMVTQCAMLEDFNIFLVLADQSLFAYHIEALLLALVGATSPSLTSQKLGGNKVVQFTVGNLGGRTVVVYAEMMINDWQIRVLEPVIEEINERKKTQPPLWFRLYRDFDFPSHPKDLLFLEASIAISCSEGFTIVDLSDLKSVTIPRKESPRFGKLVKERIKSLEPIGMFRSNDDEFLICYHEFGLYVNGDGEPSRGVGTIEWEELARQVAWHPPYILLFGKKSIEIRHVETSCLVQVISMINVRCTRDGRGINQSQVTSEDSWDGLVSQEPRVHVVVVTRLPRSAGRMTSEAVFELTLTAPLYLPGSSGSPQRASYFNDSNPPTHPPTLNPPSSSSVGFKRASTVTGGEIGHLTQMVASQSSTPIQRNAQEEQEGADTHNSKLLPIAYTAPGPSVSVDTDTPAWKRLIGHALLPREVISLIEAIFTSKDEVKMICDLCGDDAQTFINAIHEALDLPDLSPLLRAKCLSALCRICGRQALLPRSLRIPICYNRLETPLYYGGFADVWKGEYRGRHVAVKVLRVYSTSDIGKIASKFCKEVLTWNALCHPNVLPLLGVTTDKNLFAMISEWMVNGNINEFIKARPEANPFELLKEVASGLIYIHGQGMIHGDLKGANILIDQDRHARLADFGLLTIISDPTNFTNSSSSLAGGTIRWMSPELLHPELFGFNHGCPTKGSDCYALGMVIYEVLTGQSPFMPWKEHIVMMKVTGGERPERPEGINGSWFADDLWEMLGLCWETDAQSRPSIEAVSECLGRVSGAWKPLPPQVNKIVEDDKNDEDLVDLTELALKDL